MGAISSCCQKSDYASLDGGAEGSEFSGVDKDEAHTADKYNQELSPFIGSQVELKFTSKSGYEDKFVWLNSTSKTIHMSVHTTKEKRHKEASLGDVTSVVSGPPVKSKKMGEADSGKCLTVNFKRGGGIDLRFGTEKMRNEWNEILEALVKSARK